VFLYRAIQKLQLLAQLGMTMRRQGSHEPFVSLYGRFTQISFNENARLG
jgi:hypothetical protein